MGAALPALGVPTGSVFFDTALEGLVRTNEEILLRNPELPALYDAGVTYKVTGSRKWVFADQIAADGHADCEGLSGWRAAELRVSGEDPDARIATYRTGKSKFHAVVMRGDGTVEDPSAILGMPIRSPASYVGKLAAKFGEAALDGDDGVDDFYNAPPPNEAEDQQGANIDAFYSLDPQQVDMGPGVGPADPEFYGEAPPDQPQPAAGGGDSGGGGGGGGDSQDPRQQRQQGQQGQQQRPQGQQGQQQRPQGQQRQTSSSSSSSRAAGAAAGRGFSRMATAAAPKKTPPKRTARKGRTHGVDGVIDVPFICLEGPDDDWPRDDFQPGEEFGPDDEASARSYDPGDDDRDVSVDVQQTDDGGYVSTVRVPVADGHTVVAQSSKAATAKKAATKAFNIAKILANNKTVQDALPPQAKLTLAALKSDDAKKIFSQMKW